MLRLLRKIGRQESTESNNNTFWIFAFSEFVLVILGILIALQIDNWNDNRKAKKSELKYLIALQEEFSENLTELERVMNLNQRNADFAHELSKYTGPHEPVLTSNEVDSFLVFINTEVQYRPGSGVLEEIISSGKLELLSNDQLRYEIASWESIMQAVRFQELEHSNLRNNLLEMVFVNGNTKQAMHNMFGERFGLSPSKFDSNNHFFLKSLEFENHIAAFFLTARFLNEAYYSDLEKKIRKVLSIIEEELI